MPDAGELRASEGLPEEVRACVSGDDARDGRERRNEANGPLMDATQHQLHGRQGLAFNPRFSFTLVGQVLVVPHADCHQTTQLFTSGTDTKQSRRNASRTGHLLTNAVFTAGADNMRSLIQKLGR